MKKQYRGTDGALFAPLESKTTNALLCDAARLLDDLSADASKTLSLQTGARRILAFLSIRDGITQLDLIRATRLKAPTISLLIRKMELDGYIRRGSDNLDMRLSRIHLTEHGKSVCRILQDTESKTEAHALNGFSNEEKEQLREMLVRIYRNLDSTEEQ
ncbi:MAG: MarR family transcriptional regulator [Clostridia bacterium]|nr:MarR family transcriptional regulator [Clostridia bacterium]